MQELFATLTRAVEGTPLVALGAALVWGILSIVLSPCHLASIPLIVGFVGGQGKISRRGAFSLSAVFASGILVTIAGIGLITAGLGRLIGDVGPWGNYFVAAVFLIVGLHLLDVIPLNFTGASPGETRRKGLVAALLLGLIFGVALGPCTFAYMAPMLAVALRAATESAPFGALLLLAFGVGHCSVIVAAGTSTEAVQGYLDWTEASRGATILRQVCGALVILGGLYMLHTA
ncbi:MAG TPA: cytochrome C biogenesis protein [Armatimonadetes bacterium]|nr:cytochrome C biogenesis protein [Armatimonadota bacterium]